MKPLALAEFIKSQGWSDFGVVRYSKVLSKLKEHRSIFERWLQNGFNADMTYLEGMINDRYNPTNKLPDIQSIIVLTAWYGYEQEVFSREKGIVARYAAGKDYHKQLKKKLIELSDWLKLSSLSKGQNLNVENYVSVDSGPTVDRVLAECAGLGFFGKNSCIINPSKGSYFFIGTLYTNLNLESTLNKPMPNCGNCTKCAIACPTGAIVEPGVIDANRCISYLTIENKKSIPVELRSKIGNRLFGCDICQEVCPFNIGRAHKQEILITNLKSKYGVGESLDLKEILLIENDEQYVKKFAGTPLMRAKRRGLIRNACVVAGNSGEISLIPYLQIVINRESDEMLKEHAQWAIRKIQS